MDQAYSGGAHAGDRAQHPGQDNISKQHVECDYCDADAAWYHWTSNVTKQSVNRECYACVEHVGLLNRYYATTNPRTAAISPHTGGAVRRSTGRSGPVRRRADPVVLERPVVDGPMQTMRPLVLLDLSVHVGLDAPGPVRVPSSYSIQHRKRYHPDAFSECPPESRQRLPPESSPT